MQVYTFEKLPDAISDLSRKVDKMNLILIGLSDKNPPITHEPDKWNTLDEIIAQDPEHRSKPTFYGYVSRGELKSHKSGKRLLFLQSEFEEFLKKDRRKSVPEPEANIDQYLVQPKSKKLSHGK